MRRCEVGAALDERMRTATVADLSRIVQVHKAAYSRSHFTSLLPAPVLSAYYAYFFGSGTEIVLLEAEPSVGATDAPILEGFAVFGTGIPERIAAFKRDCRSAILRAALAHPFTAARKALAAVRSRLQGPSSIPPAEFLLLSIAVAVPRRGVGRRLLTCTVRSGHERGFKTIGLYVNADNIGAINAYFDAGFVLVEERSGQFYMEHRCGDE